MTRRISTALLISTYNWPQALRLVLDSVLKQTALPDEILIADDGSDSMTKKLIDSYVKKFNVPIKHFWQHHNGFQKSIILNKAVSGTTCDYIIQTDGDIILHKNFIEDHLEAAEANCYVRASRVILHGAKTKKLLNHYGNITLSPLDLGIKNRINAMRIPFLKSFFTKYSFRSDNTHGCNCAYWRNDFLKVNGYNNIFKGWGHEDIEFAARLVNAGIQQKKIKMRAVCYHLDHALLERFGVESNFRTYEESVRTGTTQCINGYYQQYTYQD